VISFFFKLRHNNRGSYLAISQYHHRGSYYKLKSVDQTLYKNNHMKSSQQPL